MCIGSVPVKWEVKFLGVTTVCYAGLPVTDTETNIQVEVGDNILVTKKRQKRQSQKLLLIFIFISTFSERLLKPTNTKHKK